jgi:hypothetical protein
MADRRLFVHAEPVIALETTEFDNDGLADFRQRVLTAYSVEKLGSCKLEIFPINQIAAENQP